MDETQDQACVTDCLEDWDMELHSKNCVKNPGHQSFIPVSEFSLSHLPLEYRDADIEDLICCVSTLTVKVKTDLISDKRTASYPFYHHRGKKVVRYGTGYVHDVKEFVTDTACPCPECSSCKVPQKTWATVLISTASHVVYDDTEARHTDVDLFYDDPGTVRPGMRLRGIGTVGTDVDTGSCIIMCSTHDRELGNQLKKTISQLSDICSRLSRKLWNPNHRLAVMVSHPHGCSKQISLGEWTDKWSENGMEPVDGRDNCSSYTYHVATCPGSSGAPVFILTEGLTHSRKWFFTHPLKRDLCMRDDSNLDKDKGNSHKNRFADAVGCTYKSLAADYNSYEADVMSIDVRVIFPLGEIKSCVIWFHKRTVKQEKERLLQESDVNYGPPHQYVMQLITPQMEVECVMRDEDLSSKYITYLAGECCIKIVKIEQSSSHPGMSASSYGVSVKP